VNDEPVPASTGVGVIAVEVDDRQHDREVDTTCLSRLLVAGLHHGGVRWPAEVGLAFVDTTEMAELNRWHMDGHGPTDVLAFPIDGKRPVPAGQPAVIGDIVICPEVAERAPQPLADELALLVVHGALHLVGHDHAAAGEAAVMKSHERAILDRHWRRK